MQKYKLINNISGWVVFITAAIVYLLTIEPTASLWDCGEFIATSFKLEVGHPPGAPFFMILARIFSLFAGKNVMLVSVMINSMSALASGFTILFLFWSITYLVKKILIKKTEDYTLGNVIAIIGSGVVGALAYTFSDTFWFSAVEGEVYASSSLFTALVFWAILKWEEVAYEKHADRWIILIAYLMGLSIGVHLLNLLVIPAIVFVYYFKKYKVTIRGFIIAFILSILILALVMYGIIQGLIVAASWFELFFVNELGLPFNSGVLFYAILLTGLLIFGISYSHQKRRILLNLALLSVTVIIIGYSSYAMVVIRSLAKTPINENSPENVFALFSYLDREQYGDRPLLYGQYYNAPTTDVDYDHGSPTYIRKDGKYEISIRKPEYKFDERFMTFFPRMFSSDGSHVNIYKEWADIKGKPIQVKNNKGEDKTLYVPTFAENLKFFLKYQVGYMYFRYFMWNFAGRQNDIQGHGGILKGNWITGIEFIDSKVVGPQKTLPSNLKNTPSRNTYYLLPLLLGLFGFLYHMDKNLRDFWIVLLLFFMTGLAIVLYLNQTPLQPRERDYAYAGSFYAFAIWIGIGVAALYRISKNPNTAIIRSSATSVICFFAVPALMGKQNWNDHDRSGRYATRAYAYDYLNSCAPNALLFTYGDNDTFPLWYAQEVEGIRTDVRVVNTMLLNTDWYIDQMRMKAYESDPLPISFTPDQYIQGKRNAVYLIERMNKPIDLLDAVQFVASDDPKTKTIPNYNQFFDYIPGKNFILKVDTEAVKASGAIAPKDYNKIQSEIVWKIKENVIGKSDLIILDILAHNNWKRPVYFASAGFETNVGLNEYLQMEGLAYRLVPIRTPCQNYECGQINTKIMYDLAMHKFDWGRINEPDVYMDHFHLRTVSVLRMRTMFVRLADALINENKKDSAIQVLDRCRQVLPSSKIPDDTYTIGLIEAYYMAGAYEKGNNVVRDFSKICIDELNYFFSLKKDLREYVDYEIRLDLQMLQEMKNNVTKYNQKDLGDQLEKDFNQFFKMYQVQGGK